MKLHRRSLLIGFGLWVGLALAWYFLFWNEGDPRLAKFVKTKPILPVVFTSRSEPLSLRAAAVIGDYSVDGIGTNGTGQPQWQAQEGRLRLLTSRGRVIELTWGKELPGGETIIDVMSPSISPNGNTVIFAGRSAKVDGGRFRIFTVNIDGSNLKLFSQGSEDTGCVRVPPLRFGNKGLELTEAQRKLIDYDDIDPALLPEGTLVFASSRQPDTGGRDRRATQIWVNEPKKSPRPLTASRANDRWPFITLDRSVVFSIWSKQDEVISLDGTELVRNPRTGGLTSPTDRWFGATISPTGENFANMVKIPNPVWRPRPLENGNLAFMTTASGAQAPFNPANETPEYEIFRVAQAPPGYVTSSPSSLSAGGELPAMKDPTLAWLNAVDGNQRPYSIATPSPIPGGVLVSAAPVPLNGNPRPENYGLYLAPITDWPVNAESHSQSLTLLFDDPEMVDAEPVAVYERGIQAGPLRYPMTWPAEESKTVQLFNGVTYKGPSGKLHNKQLTEVATGVFPGQIPAQGNGSIYPLFPQGSIQKITFYASHRDRFDDSKQMIIPGVLEKLMEVPTNKTEPGGAFEAILPVGSPTMLVGIGHDGKVVTVPVPGKNALFYAFAGDHVSGIRPGGYHFCTGCHTGHTFTGSSIDERKR